MFVTIVVNLDTGSNIVQNPEENFVTLVLSPVSQDWSLFLFPFFIISFYFLVEDPLVKKDTSHPIVVVGGEQIKQNSGWALADILAQQLLPGKQEDKEKQNTMHRNLLPSSAQSWFFTI